MPAGIVIRCIIKDSVLFHIAKQHIFTANEPIFTAPLWNKLKSSLGERSHPNLKNTWDGWVSFQFS